MAARNTPEITTDFLPFDPLAMPALQAPDEPLEAAIEALRPWLRSSEPRESTIAAKCVGLMNGYHRRWIGAPYRIDYVERVVSSDLYNPETGRTSRTFRVSSKIDVGATEIPSGRSVIFDHKTSSEDISDINGSFWRQLVIEGQPSHYMLLEWLNGRKVDYAVWDVIRKPGIAPKLLSKNERAEIQATGSYFALSINKDAFDELAEGCRETPEMYAARLSHDCIVTRPQWYFQRRQVPRLDSEVLEYAKELWDHSQDLILARRYNRHPRNSGACMLYGSPCKFLGICSSHDSIDSERWSRREWVHPELPILPNQDGKSVLTNSRIRTFQTCRRKEYLQYELGLERTDEDERDALVFGHKFHEAMEAYFLTLQSQQQKEI